MTYLTSAEGLDRLCEELVINRKKQQADFLTNGFLQLLASGVFYIASSEAFYYIPQEGVIETGAHIIQAAGTTIFAGLSAISTAKGIIARDSKKQSSAYLTEYGMTNKPSILDKISGTIVKPLESMKQECLNTNKIRKEDLIFVNNAVVKSVESMSYAIRSGDVYNLFAQFELNGSLFNAHMQTEDKSVAENLLQMQSGNQLYLFGRMNNCSFEIERFGDAYQDKIHH